MGRQSPDAGIFWDFSFFLMYCIFFLTNQLQIIQIAINFLYLPLVGIVEGWTSGGWSEAEVAAGTYDPGGKTTRGSDKQREAAELGVCVASTHCLKAR